MAALILWEAAIAWRSSTLSCDQSDLAEGKVGNARNNVSFGQLF
ncbi:hypothetical protein [Bradyrhizobium archetypum]|nr:hypothetical protein [Bradyrhizobium archetypum]